MSELRQEIKTEKESFLDNEDSEPSASLVNQVYSSKLYTCLTRKTDKEYNEKAQHSLKNPIKFEEIYIKEEKVESECDEGLCVNDQPMLEGIKLEEIYLKEEKVEPECDEGLEGGQYVSDQPTLEGNYMLNAACGLQVKKENLYHCDVNPNGDSTMFSEHTVSDSRNSSAYKFTLCDASFTSKDCYRKQPIYYTRSSLYRCPICYFGFNQKLMLSRHIEEVHNKLEPFNCSYCNYTTNDESTLSRHKKLKHGELKPFKCLSCDYSCCAKPTLLRHVMIVHKRLKPFKCSECDYASSGKYDLLRHIKSHKKIVVKKQEPIKAVKKVKCRCQKKPLKMEGRLVKILPKIQTVPDEILPNVSQEESIDLQSTGSLKSILPSSEL